LVERKWWLRLEKGTHGKECIMGNFHLKKKKIVVMSSHIILFAAVVRSNKMW